MIALFLASAISLSFAATDISATAPTLPIVPKTNLDYWNADSGIESDNNCYNYSTNRVTNSFAQPGEASGIMLRKLSCAVVLKAAAADLGVVPTEFFPFTGKQDDTLIALVVDPGSDFHWYRRDDNNLWTHKMGGSPAQDTDEVGQPITDPAKADRGSYTDFCGYFRVKNLPTEPHEQNGGQVRIGNMEKLPKIAESTVELLMYSGRRNPRYPLKDLLQDAAFRNRLMQVRAQMMLSFAASTDQVQALSHLGDRGFRITDTEGLIFPQGSRVQIKDTDVLIHAPGVVQPMGLKLSTPLNLHLDQ